MSDNEKVPLYIFWENNRWVNYKDGVKTIFREVNRQPYLAPTSPTQAEPEINIVYDNPRYNDSVVNSRNIFDNKEQYDG